MKIEELRKELANVIRSTYGLFEDMNRRLEKLESDVPSTEHEPTCIECGQTKDVHPWACGVFKLKKGCMINIITDDEGSFRCGVEHNNEVKLCDKCKEDTKSELNDDKYPIQAFEEDLIMEQVKENVEDTQDEPKIEFIKNDIVSLTKLAKEMNKKGCGKPVEDTTYPTKCGDKERFCYRCREDTKGEKQDVKLYCKNPACFNHYLANKKIKEVPESTKPAPKGCGNRYGNFICDGLTYNCGRCKEDTQDEQCQFCGATNFNTIKESGYCDKCPTLSNKDVQDRQNEPNKCYCSDFNPKCEVCKKNENIKR